MKVTGDKKTNVEFLDGSIAKLPERKEKTENKFYLAELYKQKNTMLFNKKFYEMKQEIRPLFQSLLGTIRQNN